jgi:YD repeat-containing protein
MTRFAAKTFFATVLVFLLCSVSLAQTPANTTVYIYDELGRLKAVVTPSGDTAIYSYDAAGNITSITRQNSDQVSVIEFTPDQGAVGTAVTIFGTGFSLAAAQNTVQFNGVAATVTSASATRLVAMVPAGATTGPITVTTPAGSAASTTNFQVLQNLAITGFSPTIGTPGTAVQITGTNFDPVPANNELKFNIATAGVTAATSSTLNTTVPAGATSGRISLTTPAGTATTTADFFVPPSPFTAASVDFAGRISFGETKTFSVNAANRIALLVFDATAGQRLSLQATNSTISISTISIIKPDGSNLLNPTGRSGNWFVDPLSLPVTGTYTIVIDPNSTFTGIMSLTLHNVPPDVSGTLVPSGPPVTINTTAPGQNANLSFAGTAGQRISLQLSDVSISSSTVSIRRANGTTLVSSNVTPPGVFFGTLVLPATENYSVVVDPIDTATGVMTLSLAEVPEDATGTIIIGGPQVVVTIAAPGQAAQLTFTATAGQIVSLDHPGTVPLFGSSLTISKPDGTLLQDRYGLSWSDFIFEIPVTGTYTINVNPSGGSTGTINFSLYEIPQPVTGTMTVGGPPLTVNIPAAGQIAKITFQGTAGERVSMNISNTKTGPWGSYVEITGPDGSVPGWTFADPPVFYDDDYFDFYNFIDDMVLPATGTYTITIYPDVDTSGSMDLTLYSVPPNITTTITPGGPPVTVTTTVPGQDALLTFSGTAGQRVSIKVSSVFPFTPYTCVLGPSGFVLDGTGCVENFRGRTSFWDTAVLPITGTYTIRVNGIYAGVGSATVTLYDVPPNLTGTLTIGGPPVTRTATAAGQDAEMTFAGTAGQRVSLKVSGTLPVLFLESRSPTSIGSRSARALTTAASIGPARSISGSTRMPPSSASPEILPIASTVLAVARL